MCTRTFVCFQPTKFGPPDSQKIADGNLIVPCWLWFLEDMEAPEQKESRWLMPVAAVLALLTIIVALAVPHFMGKSPDEDFAEAIEKVGGDPLKGRDAMKRYGCAACHFIPGLKGARTHVGPSLAGFANLETIGRNQRVANTPDNVMRWIIYPVNVDPTATMPGVGVTESAARDIATYLYALK